MEHIENHKYTVMSKLQSWFTRDEAARLMGVTVRTIDRRRGQGLLEDLDTSGNVRISRISIEHYLRRPVGPVVQTSHIITVPADNYNALILELQHLKNETKRLVGIEQQLEAVKQNNNSFLNRLRELIAGVISTTRGCISPMFFKIK